MAAVECMDELAVVLEPALDGLARLAVSSCNALLMEGLKKLADKREW